MIRDRKFNVYADQLLNAMERDMSPTFTSIDEAKHVFEYGRDLLTHNSLSHKAWNAPSPAGTVHARHTYMMTMLSTFSKALEGLERTKRCSWTAKEHISVSVLKLHVLHTHVSLHLEQLPPAIRPHSSQMLPQMREIVDLGQEIVSTVSSSPSSFCMGLGYIIPLYTVASQCRESSLRRRAIALLRSTSRQEGIWNSNLVARACERIMEIEESEGVELMDAAGSLDPWPQSDILPIVLHLDTTGGRLQYTLHGKRVIERVSDSVCEELMAK